MKETGVIFGILIILALAALFPLAVIMSLNTLFGFSIPFTLETWVSVIILQIFLRASITEIKTKGK